MNAINFDGQVAIVTGAGRGLGRQYAIELARRGARVLVNDLGTALDGGGVSTGPADEVAAEIARSGGTAIASHGDVRSDAATIVATAIEQWGRVDVLINNAGIPSSGGTLLAETPAADIDRVIGINLLGSIAMSKAVWPTMTDQGYGRIVNTTSGSVFGTILTAPYIVTRAAHIGLTTALAHEGKGLDIKVNAVMPTAFTRMTREIPSEEFRQLLEQYFDSDTVSPVAVLLASRNAPTTGVTYHAGGGLVARVALTIGNGAIGIDSPESALEHLDEILDLDQPHAPASLDEYMVHVFQRIFQTDAAETPSGSLGNERTPSAAATQ